MVELLLKKGPRIEAADKYNTPLHLALIGGHTRIAELIIGQGSSIGAMNNDGNSPLHLAARRNHSGLVTLLLSKGASSNAVNKSNQRPYSLASTYYGAYSAFRRHGIYS